MLGSYNLDMFVGSLCYEVTDFALNNTPINEFNVFPVRFEYRTPLDECRLTNCNVLTNFNMIKVKEKNV